MKNAFPKIETTKWYKEQIVVRNSSVELIKKSLDFNLSFFYFSF